MKLNFNKIEFYENDSKEQLRSRLAKQQSDFRLLTPSVEREVEEIIQQKEDQDLDQQSVDDLPFDLRVQSPEVQTSPKLASKF